MGCGDHVNNDLARDSGSRSVVEPTLPHGYCSECAKPTPSQNDQSNSFRVIPKTTTFEASRKKTYVVLLFRVPSVPAVLVATYYFHVNIFLKPDDPNNRSNVVHICVWS